MEAMKKQDRSKAHPRRSPELDKAWGVFDVDGKLEIQRLDELAPDDCGDVSNEAWKTAFFSDWEAIGYVFLCALAGDPRAQSALRECYGVTS
jgi:hypothetical protein